MKKTVGLLVSGFVLFSFNGCGDSKIKEVNVNELHDGYSITIEEEAVVEMMTPAEASPLTSVYKFCAEGYVPSEGMLPLEPPHYSGDYYKYIENELVEYGYYYVYDEIITFYGTNVYIMGDAGADTIYSLDTEDSSFNVGSSYNVEFSHGGSGDATASIEKIEEIECIQVPD